MNIEAQLAGGSVARSVYELDGYLQAIAQRPRIPVPNTARFRLSRFEVIERDAIVAALERSAGGVTEAAEDLGFSGPRCTARSSGMAFAPSAPNPFRRVRFGPPFSD